MTLMRATLGSDARDYVLARLRGGRTLSKLALEALDLNEGLTTAWLPAGVKPDAGSLSRALGMSSSAAESEVIRFIRAYFVHRPESALWVEEPMALRTDPFYETRDGARDGVWFYGDEPYHLAFPAEDDTRLASAIRSINSFAGWGGGGLLTRAGRRPGIELRSSDLADAAAQVDHIICGAFDGESFLVWHRRSVTVTFGSVGDLETTREVVQRSLGIRLKPGNDSYRGGDFWSLVSDEGEEIVVQPNSRLDEDIEAKEFATVVFVEETRRPDEVRRLLDASPLTFVRVEGR